MPTFSVDLYQIIHQQVFLNQEVLNVFYYKDLETGPSVGLTSILSAFNTDVSIAMNQIQSDDVTGVSITTQKVGGVNEETLDISSQAGTRPGDPRASYAAWGYILNRSTIDVRNGAKRVVGVSETDAQGNNPVLAFEVDLASFALVLEANLVLSNSAELAPVIFRRGSFVDPDWFGSNVASSQFVRLTTQNSRKELST